MSYTKNKLFVISAITRDDIANLLNDALDCADSDVPQFEENDPRLTDENCQAIADRLNDATDTSEDDERSMIELAQEAADNDWLFEVPKPKKSKKSAKK
jgi:hypothetical protein